MAKKGSPETTSHKLHLGVRTWRSDCTVYSTLSFIPAEMAFPGYLGSTLENGNLLFLKKREHHIDLSVAEHRMGDGASSQASSGASSGRDLTVHDLNGIHSSGLGTETPKERTCNMTLLAWPGPWGAAWDSPSLRSSPVGCHREVPSPSPHADGRGRDPDAEHGPSAPLPETKATNWERSCFEAAHARFSDANLPFTSRSASITEGYPSSFEQILFQVTFSPPSNTSSFKEQTYNLGTSLAGQGLELCFPCRGREFNPRSGN